MPQGTLKSGEYDIVVDEHQDRFFNLDYDLYIGGEGRTVLSVFVPSDAPDLPASGIAGMKQAAQAQSQAALLQAYFALAEVLGLASETSGGPPPPTRFRHDSSGRGRTHRPSSAVSPHRPDRTCTTQAP